MCVTAAVAGLLPEAWQFWREHGEVVGELLRIETPTTFAEVVRDSREYALEYPESGLYLMLDEEHVAWCRIQLNEMSVGEGCLLV